MIFYFSGTGNTRWAAERLAAATGERLLAIPQELAGDCRYTLAEGERIGFCFPVHGWQPPRIVRRFVSKLTIDGAAEGHYAYALCTCGDSVGRAMDIFSEELRPKGITLHSTLSLIMPESYVCLPFMYTDPPEREQAKVGWATHELGAFTELVEQRRADFHAVKRGPLPYLFSNVIGAYFNARMITDRKFTVDADRCTHCGRCARQCPVGNITLVDGQPKWNGDNSCTCCMSCYHHCPVHAIDYGRITRKRGQYYFGHRPEG